MVMIAIIVVIIVIIIVIIVVVIIIIIIVVVIFVVLTFIYDIVFILALHRFYPNNLMHRLNLLLHHHSIGLETDFSHLDRSRVGESARLCGRDRYTACHGHLVFILVNRTYCLSLCSLTLYLSL